MPTPFDNLQASVAVTEAIVTHGTYPSGAGGTQSSIAAIRHFAFNFAPDSTDIAEGQIYSIASNTALFSLVGTTYGGNGATTFAAPDLDTSLSVGIGSGPGLTERLQGEVFGEADTLLIRDNMLAFEGGTSAPVDNLAPSLGMRYLINVEGIYQGGTLLDIGMVWEFAGGFEPGGTMECDGRLLPIASHVALFSLLGTTYGGNGVTTFALPDLRGRSIVGTNDTGSDLGTLLGVETFTIGASNLPPQMGQPANPLPNEGPSLTLHYIIALQGLYPSQGDNNGGLDTTAPFLGEIIAYAGTNPPNGFADCRGQLLAINQNQALFSLLGTMYGGNGVTTFALPDLRGRALVGAETPGDVGAVYGSNQLVLELDNIPDLYVTGGLAIDYLYGANDWDTLLGLDGDDVLIAHGSTDFIYGGTGDDRMFGGAGNDHYYVDAAGDKTYELVGEGVDTVHSDVSYTLRDNLDRLELTGATAFIGRGNALDNIIWGNSIANFIDGRGGGDSMRGGDGDDTYIVDNSDDRAVEASAAGGYDTVRASVSFTLGDNVEELRMTGTAAHGNGNALANVIVGNASDNRISGRDGDDRLYGDGGNDRIFGGLGNDRLEGGDGADRFVFDTALDAANNVDRIAEFSIADDTIALDQTIFAALTHIGSLSVHFFRAGSSAQDADDHVIYDSASGEMFYDADGIGGANQILFGRVSAGLDLTRMDFVIVG